MNITVAVMAHPKRAKEAEALALELKKHPFTDVSISFDGIDAGSHQEEWDNGKRALMAGIGRGEWHLVIQDDAILCPDFYNNVVGALSAVPAKTLVSFYTGKPRPLGKRVEIAVSKAKYANWLQYWLLLWGVGIAVPSTHIEPLIDFVDDREEPYDTRIGIFYQRNRLPIYYTMPSLVDHNDDLDSLLEHGKAGGARVAHRLATGPVQWNNDVIDI